MKRQYITPSQKVIITDVQKMFSASVQSVQVYDEDATNDDATWNDIWGDGHGL